MNKTEIAAVQHEVDVHKAALERMGNEGHASDFEIDFQAGMVAGLERGLKVARRVRK